MFLSRATGSFQDSHLSFLLGTDEKREVMPASPVTHCRSILSRTNLRRILKNLALGSGSIARFELIVQADWTRLI
jgi:hypothetical protein